MNLEEIKITTKSENIMEFLTENRQQGIIQLSGVYLNSDNVSIAYTCLPGAHPKTKKYFIAIWQGEQPEDISAAIKTYKITDDSSSGSFTWSELGLQSKDYIIGLGVDSSVDTSICATLTIPKGVEDGASLEASLSSLDTLSVSSNSIVGSYVTPIFNLPATNNNWIALFNNSFNANCFKGTGVIASTKAKSDNNTGDITLNGLSLASKKPYTIVYGISFNKDSKPNFDNITAYYNFTTK